MSYSSTPYPATAVSRGIISISSGRVPMCRPGIPIFDLGIPVGVCSSHPPVAGAPTNSGHSGNGTPLNFASQGRKVMPAPTVHAESRHIGLGRSYPFHYISPNFVVCVKMTLLLKFNVL